MQKNVVSTSTLTKEMATLTSVRSKSNIHDESASTASIESAVRTPSKNGVTQIQV